MSFRRFFPGLLALTLAACGAGKPSRAPCDAADGAGLADLGALTAACLAKIDACSTTLCVDEVEAECHKKQETTCVPTP